MINWHTKLAIESVESWASDCYFVLRETEIAVRGRIDLLLVPVNHAADPIKKAYGFYYDKVRICGVEIKTSRDDFLAGLRKKQFQRYANTLSGVYVATVSGICKTSEIPPGIGHLVMNKTRRPWKCVCKRHPKYIDIKTDAATAWRILFKVREAYQDQAIRLENEYREKLRELGHIAGEKIFASIKKISDSLDDPQRGED